MNKIWQSILSFFGFGSKPQTVQSDCDKVAQTVRNYLPTAKTLLKAAGVLVLKTAVSDADRKSIASMISGSGHVMEGFVSLGVTPTEAQASNALAAYFPTKKAEYAEYVTLLMVPLGTLIGLCGNNPNGFGLFCDVMKTLAQTAYEVADPYLTT